MIAAMGITFGILFAILLFFLIVRFWPIVLGIALLLGAYVYISVMNGSLVL